MLFGRRRHQVVVAPGPAATTADLLLDEARRAEQTQIQLHAAMDQRAGVLVGFAGVLVGIMLTADSGALPAWARALALVMASTAALVAAAPLAMPSMNTVSPAELVERYHQDSRDDVVAVVTDLTAWVVQDAGEQLRGKRRLVFTAAALLVLSVGATAGGLILDLWPVLTGSGGGSA
ncbi:hypothetical protein [Cellulomonas sp.]|uniref:hypothetical protein n=1 Tax=Cellulomonas sp. TaxID=40001 RepID=UPI002811B03E|nr:hypothetical protein [Cellulomonas sp.]